MVPGVSTSKSTLVPGVLDYRSKILGLVPGDCRYQARAKYQVDGLWPAACHVVPT